MGALNRPEPLDMEPRDLEKSPERQSILEEIANLQVRKLSVSPKDQLVIDGKVSELMDSLKALDNPPSSTGPTPPLEPASELERLQAKMSAATDPDIKEALRLQIERLETTAVKKKKEPEVEEPLPEKPTGAEVLEAENLLRQAKVAQMRNQKSEAKRLIQQAADVAPGSVAVLEVLADELIAASQYQEAKKLLKRAVRIDPTNASVERKYGLMVLRTESSMNVEAMLLSGDRGYVADDANVSPKAATMLSFFIPGLGQFLLGDTKKGLVMFGVWAFSLVWVLVRFKDFLEVFAYMQNPRGVHVSWIILLPALVVLFTVITAVFDCAVRVKQPVRRTFDHPRPPVDLPFE